MSSKQKNGVLRVINEYSIFLIAGAVIALVWANAHFESYDHFVNFDVQKVISHETEVEHVAKEDHHADDEHHGTTIHWIVNDLLMALFFFMAGKEVWESFLPGGALSNMRKAATPLIATLGGIVGPAGMYLAGAFIFGQSGWFGQGGDLGRGWAIPCATDIAFSYLVARLVFGPKHPAIAFILLLAIADDAAGLLILAIVYPKAPIEFQWLLLTLLAIVIGRIMGVGVYFGKRRFIPGLNIQGWWWYLLIPGTLSWVSFWLAHIHPALGLVPIVPCFPHEATDLGIFVKEELNRNDPLNAAEHWLKSPVDLVLGLFGLVNAGVVISSLGLGTGLVTVGLLFGKPVGIALFTLAAVKIWKLEMPPHTTMRHIIVLGSIAGIGFTVALFVSDAAYPAGAFSAELIGSVKLGALASFGSGAVAWMLAWRLGIERIYETKTI